MSDAIIPAGFFADAVNPTDEEIVRWAYIEGAHYPPEMTQDWDLCVTEPRRADLLMQLASDENCPNWRFFLSCLYLLVTDWLSRQTTEGPTEVNLFLQRARALLTKPEVFDYKKWCWHGYAYGIDDEEDANAERVGRPWWKSMLFGRR